ncbi:MAG: exosortase U [Planctomycetaceae bacterium]
MTNTVKPDSSAGMAALSWKWWPVVLVTVGFLPLIYWHMIGLLNKPHYEFLYLLPFALWMLYVSADDIQPLSVSRIEAILAISLLIVSAAVLAIAAWSWSPWIAAISLQVALPGLILALGGWRAMRRWFPACVFLWILIPLPFGMDEDLIVGLRDITTSLSSSVLDQIGILHDRSANVIELPGKSLFIADACSGIHSLYVLVAAALLLSTVFRRGLVHTILLLMSTVCLVLIENVARIVLVAVLWRSGHDFSVGLKHELLGVGLFLVSLLFMLSLDQLWMFFCSTRKFSLLTWIYEKLSGDCEKYQERFIHRPHAAGLKIVVLGVSAVFPVLAMAQLFLMPAALPEIVDQTYDDFELPELTRETLPDTLNGFELDTYDEVARVPGDPLGQASRQWQYSNADDTVTAMISVDYPYAGVHDLCECYDAIGWQIGDRRVLQPPETEPRFGNLVTGPIAIGHLSRALYGSGLIVFNLDDSKGNTSAIIKDLARGTAADRAARRFDSFGHEEALLPQGEPPYIQFQMFARTARDLTAEQEDRLIELFLTASKKLRQKLGSTTADQTTGDNQ